MVLRPAAPPREMLRFLMLCALGASLAYFLRAYLPTPPRASRTHAMSVDEAAGLLGIHAMSEVTEIKAAHRRAIKETHPDTGGNAELAARINLARDTLLAYQKRFDS